MAWSVIRKATSDDVELLEKRGVAFCKRHDIRLEADDSAVQELDWHIEPRDDDDEGQRLDRQYLKGLWLAIVRRTLGHSRAEGIAWGNVGFEVK